MLGAVIGIDVLITNIMSFCANQRVSLPQNGSGRLSQNNNSTLDLVPQHQPARSNVTDHFPLHHGKDLKRRETLKRASPIDGLNRLFNILSPAAPGDGGNSLGISALFERLGRASGGSKRLCALRHRPDSYQCNQ